MARDPDILVDLTTARTEFEAETIAEALRAQGIPAQTFAIAGSVLQWDVAITQPIRVAVRRRDLEQARAILRAVRAESVDLDWSEVDTGDRTPVMDAERRAAERDRVRMRCRRCEHDVTGVKPDGVCPNCGAKLDDPWPVREARPIHHSVLFWIGLLLFTAAALLSAQMLG